MVKVYGPLMSFDASGTIAKTATFSKWKGRSYVRQRVVPANPKSALQVSVRAMLRFLSQHWASIGSTPKGTWDDLAAASQISPFNAYVGRNGSRWREFQAPSDAYPATEDGTLPVAALTSATGGPSYIDVLLTLTTQNDCNGVILFRSPTGAFDTSRANAIAVIELDAAAFAAGSLVYTDSGLDAGTYYYDARFFDDTGQLGPEEGEQSGTAT
jgi:hypothetical protein